MAGRKMPGLRLDIPPEMNRVNSFSFIEDAKGHAAYSFKSTGHDGMPTIVTIPHQGEMAGLQFSDFVLGPELGRGEGGGVRLGIHRQTGMRYALKEICVGLQQTRHQLAKEVQMHKGCGQMPHIVQLYDCFYEEGRAYLVLELMDWGSLDTLLKLQSQESPPLCMDEGVLSVIMRRILSALSFLHDEHNIMHRDLKPGNIVIDSRGVVKLSDFGTSRALENEAKGISWVGTATYMSPERLMGGQYSHKADIWSLGIIALECATGKHPYMRAEEGEAPGGLSMFALMQHVVSESPPIPTETTMSPVLIDFITRCLAKEDTERSSASELLRHPFVQLHSDKEDAYVVKWLKLFKRPCFVDMADDAGGCVLPDVCVTNPTTTSDSMEY